MRVETAFEPAGGLLRAIATGAVALERGAAGRAPVDEPAQHRAAAHALGVGTEELRLVAATDYYRVYCENGTGPVAVVDGLGTVPLAERARRVMTGPKQDVLAQLGDAVAESTLQLGVGNVLPRVALVCGSRIVDASDARRAEDILTTAHAALADHDGPAVAVIWR